MKLLLISIVLLLCSPARSQKITGKIIDTESKIPINYVHIGIIRKNKGTVSDKYGLFTLKLTPEYDKDTLRISALGYQNVSFAVIDIKRVSKVSKGELIIELTKRKSIQTKIAITPRTFEKAVIGNKGKFKPMTVRFRSGYQKNKEVGTIMKIKSAPAVIQDVNFIINSNNYTNNIPIRINIYAVRNELPLEKIFSEPVFSSKKVSKGIFTVNLEKYNIYVEDDFLVALEWIEESGGKSIGFGAGMFNQDSFHRTAGQKEWEKIILRGLGFYTTVLYLK